MPATIVTDHLQLKEAVEDADVYEIVLGADIEMTSAIDIPPGKSSLIIDGTHEGYTYTLTDMDSNDLENTLAVRSGSSISLTFQNMNMTGRNFYGIPCIYNLFTEGVSVTYRRITYTGPQLVHNLSGTTHFEDCDITITQSEASPAQEAGQVHIVDFAGETTISHDSNAGISGTVFEFNNASASFTVLENSKLTVDTTSCFMHNVLSVSCEIQAGASFMLNARKGISYSFLNRVSSFVVGAGAVFKYIQNAENGNEDSLYLNSDFIVNTGATVYMQGNPSHSAGLISMTSLSAGTLRVTDPKSFVLYNPAGAPLVVTGLSNQNFTISSEQLNQWNTAKDFPEAGTSSDFPDYKWNNTNWAPFNMTGTVSSLRTNVVSTDLSPPHTDTSFFSFQSARVISAGNIVIEPDIVIDNGRPITGLTEPGAQLDIDFSIGEESYDFSGEADEYGRFEIDPYMQIPIGTVINIVASTPFLIKTASTNVVSAGDITIFRAPESIAFELPPLSEDPLILRRADYDFPVIVNDTRPYPTEWKLMVSISGPLKAQSGEILENAVIFKDADGEIRNVSDVPIPVFTGDSETNPTSIYWDDDKGILVRLTGIIRSGAEYTTQLDWGIEVIDET